jgi:hypothetical protein
MEKAACCCDQGDRAEDCEEFAVRAGDNAGKGRGGGGDIDTGTGKDKGRGGDIDTGTGIGKGKDIGKGKGRGGMVKYKSFKDMPIWQRAMDISGLIHSLTEMLPRKEDYGFSSPIRKSASALYKTAVVITFLEKFCYNETRMQASKLISSPSH